MIIERPVYLQRLIAQKDKDIIKVVTGIRRCGKSVLLFDIYGGWLLSSGVPADHIVRVNLEDMENVPLRSAENLYAHVKRLTGGGGKYYVMIDEIQYVDGFEDLVNTLKNRGCDVYMTGSNSHLLSGDISTALRGRSIEIRVHTLSFAEYFAHRGGDRAAAWREYLLYGGFPYAAAEDDPDEKIRYLRMLEDTVATKDVIEREGLRNPAVFKAVGDFLYSNVGSLVSAKKITDTLRSSGFGRVTYDTVGSYLERMCGAFLFHKVYRRDVRGREYLKTLNKYYAADLGLRNARLNFRQVEVTHALENVVYLELVRRGYMVDIGRNREKEIDFVASDARDTYYIQVAYAMTPPEKAEQEISSFYGLDDGYKKIVLTMDDDPYTVLKNGYKKMNVLDFLLDEASLEKA
ncbi:MAG: ATP-binding protein [Mailhella sp.]|nr:ATP-binding protein [Mailhella sp.]